MDKTVKREIGQWLRSVGRPNLAGVGLMDQLRTTAFVLLGLTAAAGLGIVAIFSQQGWPVLEPSPLPPAGGGSVAIGDAAIATGPSLLAPSGEERGAGALGTEADSRSGGAAPVSSAPVVPDGAGGGVAVQLPVSQSSPPARDEPQPPSEPEPPLAPAPVEAPSPSSGEAPVPAPVTPTNPPVTSSPDSADDPVPGKGHGYGHTKSPCDEPPESEPALEPEAPPEPVDEPADPAEPSQPVEPPAEDELPEESDI
jgi:hypothetical protein